MKLFLHEVLPDSVEKAIYVDTDAFFLIDPALLWNQFSYWGPNIAVSIPYHPNLEIEEWYNASEICSCIMLLHLNRLRSVRLMDSSIYREDRSGLSAGACPTHIYGPVWTPGTVWIPQRRSWRPVVLVGHREQPQRDIPTVVIRLGSDQLHVGHVWHDSWA
jgi:hypothetical protein